MSMESINRERQLVKVVVESKNITYGTSLIGSGSRDGDRVLDVVNWLLDFNNTVPERHRAETRLGVTAEHVWEDSVSVSVEMYYMRPETDDELDKRLRHAKLSRDQAIAQHKQAIERLTKEESYDQTHSR